MLNRTLSHPVELSHKNSLSLTCHSLLFYFDGSVHIAIEVVVVVVVVRERNDLYIQTKQTLLLGITQDGCCG